MCDSFTEHFPWPLTLNPIRSAALLPRRPAASSSRATQPPRVPGSDPQAVTPAQAAINAASLKASIPSAFAPKNQCPPLPQQIHARLAVGHHVPAGGKLSQPMHGAQVEPTGRPLVCRWANAAPPARARRNPCAFATTPPISPQSVQPTPPSAANSVPWTADDPDAPPKPASVRQRVNTRILQTPQRIELHGCQRATRLDPTGRRLIQASTPCHSG